MVAMTFAECVFTQVGTESHQETENDGEDLVAYVIAEK
jgi:hypothetical protein